MINKLLKIVLLLSFIVSYSLLSAQNVNADNSSDPILYYGIGCSHCAKIKEFISNTDLSVNIIEKEIYQNPANAQEYNELCDRKSIPVMERGVPLLYADDRVYIGDYEVSTYLKDKAIGLTREHSSIPDEPTAFVEPIIEKRINAPTIPVVILAAMVDAINPCEFAVLLILMSTVLASGDKKRALYSGLAFSLSIFISYLLMGLGLYSVIASFQLSSVFMKLIGILAILLGLFNIKDYFWYAKGFLMEVPMAWRPKLKSLIRSVTSPIGTFFIGVLVSLFLLPCTSGPYIVIIGMLGQKETYSNAVWLLILYNLIFITPMICITLASYFGMNINKAAEVRVKNLRRLHLIGGLILLIMGVILLSNIIG